MPKNLVLVHLESISNTILWQYRSELETLWRIRRQSYVFNRFYTAATSSAMSMMQLAMGSSGVYDGVSYFSQTRTTEYPEFARSGWKTIFGDLFFAGYGRSDRVYYASENFDSKDVVRILHSVMAPTQAEMLPIARSALAQAKADGKPFFFHFVPYVTHITHADHVKETAKSFSDRFRIAYLRLDEAVARLMAMLVEFKLLDNTIVVFYGDHGDELWSHGLWKGWCHATTPYASQCWTPLFIYDKDRKPESTDKIASMIDLRETLVKMLLPDFDPAKHRLNAEWKNSAGEPWYMFRSPEFPAEGTLSPHKESPFNGIDLFRESRDLAFSQNLFALQLERLDRSKALVKGYAVTDGVYRVTVTSGGGDERNGGVEFFCDKVDPTNSRNLLDFFKLDADGDIREFYPPPDAVDDDFAAVFNPEAVAHLKETFNRLKKTLRQYVRDKEERAKTRPGSAPPWHTMSESAFKHALKKPYKD